MCRTTLIVLLILAFQTARCVGDIAFTISRLQQQPRFTKSLFVRKLLSIDHNSTCSNNICVWSIESPQPTTTIALQQGCLYPRQIRNYVGHYTWDAIASHADMELVQQRCPDLNIAPAPTAIKIGLDWDHDFYIPGSLPYNKSIMVAIDRNCSKTKSDWETLLSNVSNATWATKVGSNRLRVSVSGGASRQERENIVVFLSEDLCVLFIDTDSPADVLNRNAAPLVQSALRPGDQASIWARGIRGQDQIVIVADSGCDYDHCLFTADGDPDLIPGYYHQNRSKILAFIQDIPGSSLGDLNSGGHGTHVAGSVAGHSQAENSDLISYQGMAPDSKLAIYQLDFNAGIDMIEYRNIIQTISSNYGNRRVGISTNSWGSSSNSLYSSYWSSSIDQAACQNPEILFIFAAGNYGSNQRTLTTQACSKNVLTVGASTSNNYPADAGLQYRSDLIMGFSSRGPSGGFSPDPSSMRRIKPDIMAPGDGITSANSDGNVKSHQCPSISQLSVKSGTSMSTPIVAGAAALIRQYFMEGWYPTGIKTPVDAFVPSSSLLKAMVINSGKPMLGAVTANRNDFYERIANIPSFSQGFGHISLDRVLTFNSSQLFVDDWTALLHAEYKAYCFERLDPGAEIKITLVWTDPVPTPGVSNVLVNNLDLTVVNVSRVHDPNHLDDDTIIRGNARIEGELQNTWDVFNNVEQVVIPADGFSRYWGVFVHATQIPNSVSQHFSLVITGGSFQSSPLNQCGIDLSNSLPALVPQAVYPKQADPVLVELTDNGFDSCFNLTLSSMSHGVPVYFNIKYNYTGSQSFDLSKQRYLVITITRSTINDEIDTNLDLFAQEGFVKVFSSASAQDVTVDCTSCVYSKSIVWSPITKVNQDFTAAVFLAGGRLDSCFNVTISIAEVSEPSSQLTMSTENFDILIPKGRLAPSLNLTAGHNSGRKTSSKSYVELSLVHSVNASADVPDDIDFFVRDLSKPNLLWPWKNSLVDCEFPYCSVSRSVIRIAPYNSSAQYQLVFFRLPKPEYVSQSNSLSAKLSVKISGDKTTDNSDLSQTIYVKGKDQRCPSLPSETFSCNLPQKQLLLKGPLMLDAKLAATRINGTIRSVKDFTYMGWIFRQSGQNAYDVNILTNPKEPNDIEYSGIPSLWLLANGQIQVFLSVLNGPYWQIQKCTSSVVVPVNSWSAFSVSISSIDNSISIWIDGYGSISASTSVCSVKPNGITAPFVKYPLKLASNVISDTAVCLANLMFYPSSLDPETSVSCFRESNSLSKVSFEDRLFTGIPASDRSKVYLAIGSSVLVVVAVVLIRRVVIKRQHSKSTKVLQKPNEIECSHPRPRPRHPHHLDVASGILDVANVAPNANNPVTLGESNALRKRNISFDIEDGSCPIPPMTPIMHKDSPSGNRRKMLPTTFSE